MAADMCLLLLTCIHTLKLSAIGDGKLFAIRDGAIAPNSLKQA
ncbi:MAG: hypothetical protein AAFW75_14160 [Cyanobacteria bacterium J06636_16]